MQKRSLHTRTQTSVRSLEGGGVIRRAPAEGQVQLTDDADGPADIVEEHDATMAREEEAVDEEGSYDAGCDH